MKLRVPISGNLDASKGISILSTRLKHSNSKRDKHLHRRKKIIPFNLNFGLLFIISSIFLILPTGMLNPLIDTNQVFASSSTSTSTSTFDNGSVPFSNSGKEYDDDDDDNDSDDSQNLPSYKLVSSKDPFAISGNVIDSNDDLSNDDIEDKDLQSSELSSNPSSSQVSTQSSNEVYGDFNGDGFDELAIGVPREDVDTGAGTQSNAGAVHVLYSSSNGLSATSPRTDQFWTQDISNVNDLVEVGDEFGQALR